MNIFCNWVDQKFTAEEYKRTFSFSYRLIKRLASNIDFKFYQKLPIDEKDGSYDGIVLYAVIEHLEDAIQDEVLQELYRISKEGGNLYIAKLPRLFSYQEFLARKLGFPSHNKLYTRSKITKMLNKYGFEVVKIDKTGLFFNYGCFITRAILPFTRLLENLRHIPPFSLTPHDYRIIARKN